jgi:hypothetical protein
MIIFDINTIIFVNDIYPTNIYGHYNLCLIEKKILKCMRIVFLWKLMKSCEEGPKGTPQIIGGQCVHYTIIPLFFFSLLISTREV